MTTVKIQLLLPSLRSKEYIISRNNSRLSISNIEKSEQKYYSADLKILPLFTKLRRVPCYFLTGQLKKLSWWDYCK